MKPWCKRINWLWATGVPAVFFYLTYLTNFRGWASNLDAAAFDVAPLLGALVPFVGLVIGLGGLMLLGTVIVPVLCRWHRNYRYGDVMEFEGYREALATCADMVVKHSEDRVLAMSSKGYAVRSDLLFQFALEQLLTGLSTFGIPVPKAIDFTQPGVMQALIAYLTRLESLAIARDLNAARAIQLPPELRIVD